MDEKNSMLNSKNLGKKNIYSRKIKNLKQNFNDSHQNEYNIFRTKLGKTEKSSPIHFHNKLIGFIKENKTNLNIKSMISKYNKNIKIEISKNNSKSKSNPRSNSKLKKSNQKKEVSRNGKKDSSKFSKINLNRKLNNISNNSIKSKHYYESKTQNNSNNQTKIKNNKEKKGKEKNNKILQRNLIFNNDNNSNKNNISNFNLVTATKQSHNLKVMKMINNILTKKKKNEKKYPITTINSRKNTNSKEKKNSKNKYNNNITQNINRKRNIYNNNNKIIKNLNNINFKTNNNINTKKKNKCNNKGTNIIRNIVIFSNNKNKYQPIMSKYTNDSQKKTKLKQNNDYYMKPINFTQTSNNIKNKQNKINNNNLLNSFKSNIINRKNEYNSKTKTKQNLKKTINKKNYIYRISKYNDNLNSNLTYIILPLTSNNTKIINNKKITKTKDKSKTKSKSKSSTKTKNFNNYNNYFTNKKSKSKSQSNSKNKKHSKTSNKYKENNNLYINRYSMNKKQKNIINIDIHYYNKRNKVSKKLYNIGNKKTDFIKRNYPNINNFIINIFQNKSTYPDSNIDYQKTVKSINLTTSLLQSNSKRNKYTNVKNDKNNLSIHSIKKSDSINNTKDVIPSIINNKDSYYYNEISKKLSEKIRKYGKDHNYKEYPKTDLSFYKIGRSIGHGAFGKVNIALHVLSGHIVSIKSFNKKKNLFSLNKIKNEVKIMNKLRKSENIVKLFELFETKDYYCLVMENVVGGNLLNAINKMNKIPENLSKIIFKQLILTLQFMHSNNIVHRDIKPDNILLDLDNTIKLCDFGVSKIIPQGQLINDSCGTPAFIAPEILMEKAYNPYFTDIWSSGVVLYAMVTGFFPFRGINETQLHENILTGIYPKPNNISGELLDLLSKILDINPSKRISIEEILKHPWLSDTDCINNAKNKYKDFSLNLFTKAEKIIYGKMKLNYKKVSKDIQLENFTNKNIDSYYEEENQNVQTMSFVFTPYNTNREKDEDEDLYYDDVNIEDDIIQFTPKVQEISRLYEIHNNYEFDQGYIIEKKELWRRRLKVSIKNTIEKDKDKNNKKSSEKKEVKDSSNNNLLKLNVSMIKGSFNIDEEALKYVENFGYKKEYIIKSLESNELNHATATYYLKLSLKK